MKSVTLLSFLGAASTTYAQSGAWGQCGGQTWTGATTCISGYYCSYQNPYYWQCLPGTGGTTVTTSVAKTSTTTSSTKVSSTSSKTTTSAVSSATSYAKVSGSVFEINGKAEYFMGTNCYWCGFLTLNSDIDQTMADIAASGLKVVRVWGFNDVTSTPGSGTVWYQSFVSGQSPVINTGANGLQRLDYVVQSAAAHGLSLIINFVNNWTDYGGMQAYSTYYGIALTDWYTSAAAQAQYQAYIKAVVSRYKTSTAVFAWELANEARCTGCATSVMTNWVTQTAAYIKSLDANHMVTTGSEGFGLDDGGRDTSYPYTTGPGTNFTADLAAPNIDFGTYHLYPSSWGETDAWGSGWITDHATAAAAVGKPVILEEYGSLTHADELPWQAAVLASQTAADLFWQYGDTLSNGQTSNDGYTLYYGSSEYASLVTPHAAAMLAKAV